MSLAAPAWLAAGAAAAGLLVLWYLLRPRRTRQPVASTYLWEQTDRSVTAAAPWQRFRGDATFWLVLLALAAVALAVARPSIATTVPLGDHTILVIDASGSMLAEEEGGTRLDLARREAETLLADLDGNRRISVVEAGNRGRVLLTAATERRHVRDALRRIDPVHGSADLVDALTLATALQRPGETTIVHLFTDTVPTSEALEAAPRGLVVTGIGSDRNNLAVTRLATVPVGAGTNQVLVQVRNFGVAAVDAQVLVAVDGTDVVEESVRLAPRSTEDLVLRVPGTSGTTLGARVEADGNDVAGNPVDALPLDDEVVTVLSAPRALQVLLVGPQNRFVEAALSTVPGVSIEHADVLPEDAALAGVDVLVIDRAAAPAVLPRPTLLIAPTMLPDGVESVGQAEQPSVIGAAFDHELLADVELAGTAIASADILHGDGLVPVVSAADGPLLLAGRVGDAPVVALPFDLLATDLPLRPAWPILVGNVLSWLAGPPAPPAAMVGTPVPVPVPAGVESVTAHGPGDVAVPIDPATGRLEADRVGLWRIAYTGEEQYDDLAVAVHPDPDEGDLARARPGRMEREAAVAALGVGEGRRSLVWPLAAAALLVAVVEWALAFRRRRRRPEALRGAGR